MQVDVPLVLSIAAILSVIVSPVIASFLALRQSQLTLQAEKRKEEREFYLGLTGALIELRSKLQFLHAPANSSDAEKNRLREELYGKAYGIMLSIEKSEEIRTRQAEILMSFDTGPTEKLAAIDFAIKKLGRIVHDLYLE